MKTPQTQGGLFSSSILLTRWLAIVALAWSVASGGLSARAADTLPPDIHCRGDKFAECGAQWAFDIPTAVDAVDANNVLIEVVATVTNVLSPRCPALFSVTRTWRATDTSGNASFCNQTVTVVDTQPPSMTCGQDKHAECGTTWAFDIPTAVDKCDLNNVLIEVVSTVTNVINPGCPALFSVTRTWRATDTCGNASFCNQSVTIVDTEPPKMHCGPDKSVQLGDAWAFDIPTAVDLCDLNNVLIEVVSTVTNVVNPTFYSVTRTWRATDTCGNASFCNQTVTVRDQTVVTAPLTISSVTASPAILNNNHKMVTVTVNVLATSGSPPVTSAILSVTSSEPPNGTGDGNTPVDWIIPNPQTDPLTVQLRAERSGTGVGRTYTITVQCTDAGGGSAMAQVTVSVPK
jgi:hypothetical protein